MLGDPDYGDWEEKAAPEASASGVATEEGAAPEAHAAGATPKVEPLATAETSTTVRVLT